MAQTKNSSIFKMNLFNKETAIFKNKFLWFSLRFMGSCTERLGQLSSLCFINSKINQVRITNNSNCKFLVAKIF